MFRIVCDPSSGSTELYLTEIIRGGSLMFVVCLVGVWQRNFEPVVCVTVRRAGTARRTVHKAACLPLVHKFAGSNPAEAVGFLRAKKSSVRLPSEGK